MVEVAALAADYDVYAYYGRKVIERHKGLFSPTIPPRLPPTSDLDSFKDLDKKVGIIGAGIGGLYTALMLDSIGIPYEILEASQRTGGRLYTHHFEKGTSIHDYFDVGAMRFPVIKAMKRLFHLFEYEPLNSGDHRLKDKLIPYHFKPIEPAGAYLLYNKIRLREEVADSDPYAFRVREYLGGTPDAQAYINARTENILTDAIEPFIKKLEEDLKTGSNEGWHKLMEQDSHSLRSFLSHTYIPSEKFLEEHPDFPKDHLPSAVVNWMETMETSTGSFDKAFSEAVLDAIAFGGKTWKCLDGGAQVLSTAVQKYLQQKNPGGDFISFNKKVASIRQVNLPNHKQSSPEMEVKVGSEDSWRKYSHVVSTIPLTCLRTLDLDGCNLTVKQMNAMRQLLYGPSIKVGVLFKSAWWSQSPVNITGGQSFTDHPIRTVCYPSYGLKPGPDETHVLIASYCWTDDAARLGALINTGDPAVDKELTHIVLRDLAALHGVELEILEKEFVDIFSYDWGHDPLTMGAFAFYGPGSFSTLYESMISPAAQGHLHFAGEAVSTRHAWVVGALNSAWRAVDAILYKSWPEKLPDFHRKWGVDEEWISSKHLKETPKEGERGGKVDIEPDLLYRYLYVHGEKPEND